MATQTQMIETAKAYFAKVDGGELPLELFTPDFEFYFPKFGVGRGAEDFREFGSGLWAAGYKAQHHKPQLTYTATGRQVIVEGTTEGSDGGGRIWNGGETLGGRFCSVFDFAENGRIARMYIYLGPDYTGLDRDRFHWRRAQPRW
jgi:hypothetical protein